ncbi:hypothetical protein HRbin16_00371 [bacterium HR16]|nr:hypothetical protein HRbin16_00371 [bacterium HR16]
MVQQVDRTVQHRRLTPPSVYHSRCQFQIATVSRLAIQFYQSHFRFGMPTGTPPALRSEQAVEQVRETPCDVEQFVFAGHTVMGDSRLCKMPEAVNLMRVVEVGEAQGFALTHEMGVHVTVLFLRRRDDVHKLIYPRFERAVLSVGIRPARTFQPFVAVGIDIAGSLHVTRAFTAHHVEIGNGAALPELCPACGDACLDIGAIAFRQKPACQIHFPYTNGLQASVSALCGLHHRCCRVK